MALTLETKRCRKSHTHKVEKCFVHDKLKDAKSGERVVAVVVVVVVVQHRENEKGIPYVPPPSNSKQRERVRVPKVSVCV